MTTVSYISLIVYVDVWSTDAVDVWSAYAVGERSAYAVDVWSAYAVDVWLAYAFDVQHKLQKRTPLCSNIHENEN